MKAAVDLESLVAEVADQFTDEVKRGRSPSIEEYAQSHPEIAHIIRQVFPALAMLDDFSATGLPDGDEDGQVTGVLGDFRILRELGRGGMGVVYEAEQISLGRRVALKVLPFAAMLDKQQLARFKNEARAAATLDHPNIVAIHSVGTERGVHYYAMQLVDGRSLAQVIARLRTERTIKSPPAPSPSEGRAGEGGAPGTRFITPPLTPPPEGEGNGRSVADTAPVAALSTIDAPHSSLLAPSSREYFRTVARLGIQAAEALDHAHKSGVLHRDVKPANLMVDGDGKLWVTDFGLARLEADAGITMTGDLLGTLRYMSPEQALAKRVVVDHRSDIYSLGVTLYELLTLAPAFPVEDRQEHLRRIAFDEPRPMRKIEARIPRDLDTIVLKAIEKSPERRYATACDLADDLRRFVQNHPIRAKRPTWRDRAVKWSRRHVAAGWSALAASLLAAIVLGVSALVIVQSRNEANTQRALATREKDKAINQRDVAKLNQYYAEIVSGQSNLEHGNIARLHQKLIRHLPLDGEHDRRGWEWYYLFSFCHPESRPLYHPRQLVFAAWSPDGDYVASAGAIWKADTGECVRLFTPALTLSMDVAWSPDSQRLAWGNASDDCAIHVWDRRTDAVRDLPGHDGSVWCVAFSPDGAQLASGALDHTVKIWDVATGAVMRSLPAQHSVTDIAWSPDGELLAVGGSWGDGIQIYSTASGDRVMSREDSNATRTRISWRPDGLQLAVNTPGHWYILDRSNWKTVVEHDDPFGNSLDSSGADIEWNSSGTRLAITHGNVVSLWDPVSDRSVGELVGHVQRVNSVGWSPDGRRLVTSDAVREIRIWDLDAFAPPPDMAAGEPLHRLAWEADSETLVSVVASDLSSSIWSASDGKRIDGDKPADHDHEDPRRLSPDGRLIAQLIRDGDERTITVRDASTGAVQAIWRQVEAGEPTDLSWSPDASKLAITLQSTAISGLECWDVQREQAISRWIHASDRKVYLPVWSPHGARVAVVGKGDIGDSGAWYGNDHVHVIEVNSGKRILKRPMGFLASTSGTISALRWNASGQFLAIGSSEGVIEIVNVDAQRVEMVCKAHDVSIRALDWSPDGRRLGTAAADGAVKVIESRDGSELLALRTAQQDASHIAWSPDGRRLAAATDNGTIHVWDASRAYEFAAGGSRSGELAWAYYQVADESDAVDAIEGALRKSVDVAPRELAFRSLRGSALARLGQYDDAAKEFGEAVPAQADLGLGFALLRAYALLGARDLEAYRDLHRTLVKSLSETDVLARRVFGVDWLGALVPNAVDGFKEDVEFLRHAFAKEATEGAGLLADKHLALPYGAMLYRLKTYDDAVDVLSALSARPSGATDQESEYYRACAEYFLAMTRHELGHDVQARRLLDQARATDETLQLDPRCSWTWRVVLNTLRREAQELISP